MLRQHASALIVCLACAASVGGHWWIARHSERRLERLISRSRETIPSPDPLDGTPLCAHPDSPQWAGSDHSPTININPPAPDEFLAKLPAGGRPPGLLARLTYENPQADDNRPADALCSAASDQPAPDPEPERPLTRRQLEERAAVRSVIEEEMLEASAEERDIWFDELKSLPAEVVRDLLQVRRQLRVLSPDHPLSGPSPLHAQDLPQRSLEGREIAAEPVTQSRVVRTGDWSETRQALEQAIAWSTHNLANAATPGYKRIQVALGDAYVDDSSGDDRTRPEAARRGIGCRIAALSLDAEQAVIAETGREFDVAIDGPGFFLVTEVKSGRWFYTRRGQWKLTDDRRLALALDEAEYLVDAELKLPERALAIEITADGVVQAMLPDEDAPKEIGRIKLARVADPSQLIPRGNGLLSARGAAEPVTDIPGGQGLGVLRQRSLEQSNVDADREQSERERWQGLLQSLPAAEIPRTARDGGRLPN